MSEHVPKVQFNVYLTPDLVRRIKHRAIDENLSLSALVERALTAEVEQPLNDMEQPLNDARPPLNKNEEEGR